MHAGFRPGKTCTCQLLNLTQHIEDFYQAFVDLYAAYETVNHNLIIQKLYITKDSTMCRVLQCLLSNRSLYMELNNGYRRWRKQKNGLSHGNVIAPTPYNIYLHQRPSDPRWKQELHLHRRAMYHDPVPVIQAS